jgi:hypothetical protein
MLFDLSIGCFLVRSKRNYLATVSLPVMIEPQSPSGAFSTTSKALSCHIMREVHFPVFSFHAPMTPTHISEASTNLDCLEVKDSWHFVDGNLARRTCRFKVRMQDLNGSMRKNT